MRLVQLRGEYFRNIDALDIECSPTVNLIYGNNGSGKSTLLEMIYCLSRGRSFRTHLSSRVIQYTREYCTVFGRVHADHQKTSVGFQKLQRGKTLLRIGQDKKAPTFKELSTLLPVQLFHPESHDLLRTGPSIRRKFIDWGLFYKEVGFIENWQRFHQALKQRNAALAQKHNREHIQSWDRELIQTGEQLAHFRKIYVDELIIHAQTWMDLFLEKLPCSLSYYTGWEADQSLSITLDKNLDKDKKYGYTTSGPHRFDLLIQSNGLHVSEVFSRGEQKRLICALYLAQGQLFKQQTGMNCIYLLDDILSELDNFYQSKVLEVLTELNAQLFVTSLDERSIEPLFTIANHKKFPMVDGRILNPP